jgi:hypothetical protein
MDVRESESEEEEEEDIDPCYFLSDILLKVQTPNQIQVRYL